MTVKKIVPCMDIRDGKVVKGVNFEGIRDVADPVELAKYYNESGADAVIFYDIAATVQGRNIFGELLRSVAEAVTIPLIVGGGIATPEDFDRAVEYGAAKVSINSGAINNPDLIEQVSAKYGSKRVILSMDVKAVGGEYRVFKAAGQVDTGLDAIEWARTNVAKGAGELVVNSIDTDGVKGGYDMPLLKAVSDAVDVPIVASGGAGKMEDFLEVFKAGYAETGLAASVFHFKEINIGELKKYLAANGISVNI